MPDKDSNPPPPPPRPRPAKGLIEGPPPKPKEARNKVSFAPMPEMSMTPSAHPRHQSGHVSYHRPPQVTWTSGTGADAGQVRVTGGSTTTHWHNYEANVPIKDILAADPQQQAAILGAVDLAQRGRSSRTSDRHSSGRVYEIEDNKAHKSSAQPQNTALAIAGPELAPPAPKRRPSPSSVSKAGTKISHHSHSSHDSRGSKKSNRSNTKAASPAVLTCVSCGQEKKPNVDNVKPIKAMADMPLCWKCVVEHLGSVGGETWFSNAWAMN